MKYRQLVQSRVFSASLVYTALSSMTLLLIGCADDLQTDPNRARVSGMVTFDGQPLPAGTITFASPEGGIASAVSIRDGGRYSSERVPIGKNVVSIDTASIQYGNPAAYVPIPEKYSIPVRSGLEAEIKPGENENVNFELEK